MINITYEYDGRGWAGGGCIYVCMYDEGMPIIVFIPVAPVATPYVNCINIIPNFMAMKMNNNRESRSRHAVDCTYRMKELLPMIN